MSGLETKRGTRLLKSNSDDLSIPFQESSHPHRLCSKQIPSWSIFFFFYFCDLLEMEMCGSNFHFPSETYSFSLPNSVYGRGRGIFCSSFVFVHVCAWACTSPFQNCEIGCPTSLLSVFFCIILPKDNVQWGISCPVPSIWMLYSDFPQLLPDFQTGCCYKQQGIILNLLE